MSTKPVVHGVIPTPAPAAKTQPAPTQPQTEFKPSAETAKVARSGRKKVPKDETPEQSFKRLVEPRVTKLLKSLKHIKNLARFKPTEAQRVKVFAAIREALTVAETSWKNDDVSIQEKGFTI